MASIPFEKEKTTEQIIWAAGFFDGEGCISIYKHDRNPKPISYDLTLQVVQIVREPIEIFKDLWSGSIHYRNAHDCWAWTAAPKVAVVALTEMLPYLVLKRGQAEIALAFQSRKLALGGRHASDDARLAASRLNETDYLAMKELKARRG